MTKETNLVSSTSDIEALRESSHVECKKSLGKNKKGEVPKSFWETYSAFANTDGGEIFLGVEEHKDKSFSVVGIPDPEKVMQDIFNTANSTKKVSVNLLSNSNVKILSLAGNNIIRITIPRASRKVRPVYVGSNPLTGSYHRLNEGDFRLSEDKIIKMLANQSDSSFDSQILKTYDETDFDHETIQTYRKTFTALKPTHPYVGQDFNAFMKSIGAWQKDEEEGVEGFTLAGLIMFGKQSSILNALPNFSLDYQERPDSKTEIRWIDRVTLDGSWSGNLYDFYNKVYRKLTADLKVPFVLKEGIRQDETPIHEALRETLANALLHADYSESASVLVIKKTDMFSFRNPGLMRISIDQAIAGGESDCRNKNLQKMFQFIGVGEHAGSGVPRIFNNWRQQHWRTPKITEKISPDQTLFELHMVSLIPQDTLSLLEKQFGEKFKKLTGELQVLILATAHIEETVDHKRIREIASDHPADISKALANLVESGFLYSQGSGRGTIYRLSESGSDDPMLDDLEDNSWDIRKKEMKLASKSRKSKKLSRDDMEHIIIALCAVRPQTIETLAKLLDRSKNFLRSGYIRPMLRQGKIEHKHKNSKNHPDQSYIVPDKK